MIVKEIMIDGKAVKFAASASIPRIYRQKFNADIMLDMQVLAEDIQNLGDDGKGNGSNIPYESITIFENVSYIMAKHADSSVPDSIYEWLDEFQTFSIYEVFPELLDLWNKNNQTMSVPKKK